YLPDGGSKFGAAEITPAGLGEQSLLRYRLFIDGEEVWQYTLLTPPDVRGWGKSKDAIWG
ncbi:hypothetical protein LTS18_007279, partial [Coniosporium uncinatum]